MVISCESLFSEQPLIIHSTKEHTVTKKTQWSLIITVFIGLVCIGAFSLITDIIVRMQDAATDDERRLQDPDAFKRDALEKAEELIRHPPKDIRLSSLKISRAIALARLGRIEEALTQFEEVKKEDPDGYGVNAAASSFASALAQQGTYADAIRIYEETIKKFPRNPLHRFSYGYFLAFTKNDAVQDTARGARLQEEGIALLATPRAEEYEEFAEVLAIDGHYDDAVKAVEKAVTLRKGQVGLAEEKVQKTEMSTEKKYREQQLEAARLRHQRALQLLDACKQKKKPRRATDY